MSMRPDKWIETTHNIAIKTTAISTILLCVSSTKLVRRTALRIFHCSEISTDQLRALGGGGGG